MSISRKGWLALAVAAAAIALVLLGLAGRGDSADVTVVPVTRQNIEDWLSTNGKVEPITPYVLRARFNTFVTRLGVVSGQSVKKGQLLAELDSSDARAQLAAARENLLAAQQDLAYAQAGGPPDERAQIESSLAKAQALESRLAAEQTSLESLVRERAATPDELAQNSLQLKQAEADLAYWQKKQEDMNRQARFNAAQARLRATQASARIQDLTGKVGASRMVAPADGTVYALPVKLGDYVQVGDPVISLADLSRVWVRAYVDEVDLGVVALNQPVIVQWDGLPDRTWTGSTERIPKQVVPYQDRLVGEVLCSVANAGGQLIPNTNVDVRIRVAREAAALVVPRAAVQGEGFDRYAFLVVGNRLQRQPVKLGIHSVYDFQVVEGLKDGDQVALPGAVDLKDGMQVHPVQVR